MLNKISVTKYHHDFVKKVFVLSITGDGELTDAFSQAKDLT